MSFHYIEELAAFIHSFIDPYLESLGLLELLVPVLTFMDVLLVPPPVTETPIEIPVPVNPTDTPAVLESSLD